MPSSKYKQELEKNVKIEYFLEVLIKKGTKMRCLLNMKKSIKWKTIEGFL